MDSSSMSDTSSTMANQGHRNQLHDTTHNFAATYDTRFMQQQLDSSSSPVPGWKSNGSPEKRPPVPFSPTMNDWRNGMVPPQMCFMPGQSAQPSFGGTYGAPLCAAPVDNANKGVLPKHFHQPLTCFYWHTNGHCNKTEEECMYAHWPTGVVASGPVSMGTSQAAVAGHNATKQLNEHAKREKQLRDREAALVAKEMALNGKMGGIAAAAQNGCGDIASLPEMVDNAKTMANKAYGDLCKIRDELALAKAVVDGDSTKEPGVEFAIEAAMATVSELVGRFSTLEAKLRTKYGQTDFAPEAIQLYLDATQ